MSGKKRTHRKTIIGDNWILICGDNLEMTRADSNFGFCPFCGDSL